MRLSLHPVLALTALVVVLVSCATSPLGRRQFVLVSDAEVSQAGVTSFRDMQKKMPQSTDTQQVAYVNCVSSAIVGAIPRVQAAGKLRIPPSWEVSVFNSKDVNAFALPGGYVYVTRGIMDYVKKNSLNNKQDILPDAALRKLLSVTEAEKVTILNLQRFLKVHYVKAPVA